MQKISIGIALAEIDKLNNTNQEFTIGYRSAKTFEYKVIRAKKGYKTPQNPSTQKNQENVKKAFHSIKDNRLLFIFDVNEKKPKNLKIDLIIKFNGISIAH